MKTSIILFLILCFYSCQKENTSNLKLINEKLTTDNLTNSTFILQNDTVIEGRFGTEVFIPKDLFSNYTNSTITMELKEFYRKEDMILNKLSTITDKNELLESSGMLYINFFENGKQLEIQNGKTFKINLPEKPLANSNIYTNDNDSIFQWKLTNTPLKVSFPDIIKNYDFRISVDETGVGGFYKEITVDSLEIVKGMDSLSLDKKLIEEETRDFNQNRRIYISLGYTLKNGRIVFPDEDKKSIKYFSTKDEIYNFSINKLGWINIDKVLNFEVQNNYIFTSKKPFDRYSASIIYLDSKSYIEEFITNEFNAIPIKIRGKLKIVIYTNDENTIYYDSFYLDKNSKTNFELHLKETTLEKLKNILITP